MWLFPCKLCTGSVKPWSDCNAVKNSPTALQPEALTSLWLPETKARTCDVITMGKSDKRQIKTSVCVCKRDISADEYIYIFLSVVSVRCSF